MRSVSTVPSNGDLNPYGVAFIGRDFTAGSGPLRSGDILVSNFNNAANLQGTGTTIVDVPGTGGAVTVFFQGTAPLGLTTALGVLRKGFVVVGNGPSKDGTFATASAGSLLVIDNEGHLRQTITDPTIQYPWDMALVDRGGSAIAFVSNALNGTVSRLTLDVGSGGVTLDDARTIASGYMHRADPVALVLSPTGLVYDRSRDVLYVASTADNKVFAVHDAASRKGSGGTGNVVYQDSVHLHGALAMARAPNGHLLVSNVDSVNADPTQPSEIVEFTTSGKFVKQLSVDPMLDGSFGLAVLTAGDDATLAAVDDNTNSLLIWQIDRE
ncbi:hypothetical protein [Dokdonella soli]|uniref:hypothetical protein n=1 Tax=Dokdonella soli TaxID=529810 RepID=UPI0031D3E130